MAKARTPFTSIFGPTGPREVGDVFRDKLGGPFHPVERFPTPREPWFCEASGCSRWSNGQGEYNGTCAGYCLSF